MNYNNENLFYARLKIYQQLHQLPKGTIKERIISGKKYYYLQRREGKKVVHTYLGKAIPKDLEEVMLKRQELRRELEKLPTYSEYHHQKNRKNA